ncbi:tetratricopeptide repeat protein [Janthinobacterium sp. RB2R34]|uniref:tetratricopeptide repeat protein n=1 Tax=Janthinobacterium sp. RB2R34 TaxID=3424193 RepID=UPI003F269E17
MSLINKMLQDLDARSKDGHGQGADTGGIRPVPERERGLPRAVVFGGAAGLTAIAIALGWIYWKRPEVPPVLVNVAQAPVPVPVSVPTPVPVRVPVVAAAPEPAVVPQPEPMVEAAPAAAAPMAREFKASEPRRVAPKPVTVAAVKPVPVVVEKIIEGKQVTPQQSIDNTYRRALGDLQDGRVDDAMNGLQRTLQRDPRHQGARETLVRLLLEAQRPDEAVRQLQQSLALDPKQPAQAMMLARLQLDRSGGGAAALDTLKRSLPFAGEHLDYRAFLAGVLQREQHYREAAEQYQLALQSAPDNSVWWMGLGIALQADNQAVQAKAAFERAKALQTLSPQLQAFVERKLVQLAGAGK